MTLIDEIGMTVFRRSKSTRLSEFGKDMKIFNVIGALDGKRTVQEIATMDRFDPEFLAEKLKTLYEQGFIEKVVDDGVSRGQAKKIIDAIIKKRSRGVGALVKSVKIKLALKGIPANKLTADTPDDPVLITKLIQLAKSYGLQVQTHAGPKRNLQQTQGRTKLILDSIITQRSGGNAAKAKTIKTKLILKGINPDAYSLDTVDDPNLVKKLTNLAEKLNVTIPTVSANVDDQIDKFL
jgi:DNA-binding MarR family transcriptional regulator